MDGHGSVIPCLEVVSSKPFVSSQALCTEERSVASPRLTSEDSGTLPFLRRELGDRRPVTLDPNVEDYVTTVTDSEPSQFITCVLPGISSYTCVRNETSDVSPRGSVRVTCTSDPLLTPTSPEGGPTTSLQRFPPQSRRPRDVPFPSCDPVFDVRVDRDLSP